MLNLAFSGSGGMDGKAYRQLEVWQIGMELASAVYELTAQFPEEEKYGLVSQMRRASVSIPANIAEGYGRDHRGDYLRFLSVARGSLMELETHIILAVKLSLVQRRDVRNCWQLAQRVGSMLTKLTQSLKKTPKNQNPRPQPRTPRPDHETDTIS